MGKITEYAGKRTFILGAAGTVLSLVSILSIASVIFFGKTHDCGTYFGLIFLSAFLGGAGIIKPQKGWLGKTLCAFPIGVFSAMVIFFLCVLYELSPHTLPKKQDLEMTSERLGLDLSGGKYIKRIETHDGFFGDGEYYARIKFADAAQVLESLRNNKDWKDPPLPRSLLYLLYDDEEGDTLDLKHDKRMFFPNTENCRYFFINRSVNVEYPENMNPDYLLDRTFSWNFTVAVFDLDKNILYVYELDT